MSLHLFYTKLREVHTIMVVELTIFILRILSQIRVRYRLNTKFQWLIQMADHLICKMPMPVIIIMKRNSSEGITQTQPTLLASPTLPNNQRSTTTAVKVQVSSVPITLSNSSSNNWNYPYNPYTHDKISSYHKYLKDTPAIEVISNN